MKLRFVLLTLVASAALARVDHVDVIRRQPLPYAYEKLEGRVYFRVLPGDPHNRDIVDLDLAPRNAAGEVEFSADFFLMRPLTNGNGALLLEIPNRGGKGILAIANRGKGSLDPATNEELGDGFLMKRGFTVGWLGWQWDARVEPHRVRLDAPVAMDHGKSITGLVRSDFVPSEAGVDHPLGHWIGGAIGGTEYEVVDPGDRANVLTVRDSPAAARQTIPRRKWSFSADRRSVHFSEGFVPGRIYEIVYQARDPHVAGLGLAAVRDFVAYLKHDPHAIAPVSRALGVGISQSGRFLRHFLYEGFNADEQGRQVFDGVDAHVAGAGRGSFNYRFAQPSRDGQPRSALFYATDLEPFTDDGLLARATAAKVAPKLFLTNTSYEYWSRAASLTHTTRDGSKDIEPGESVRIYHYAGLQHFSGRFPPERATEPELMGQQKQNPLPVAWLWRAAIVNLDAWVAEGTLPPPNRFPHISDGTLVRREGVAFPKIAGLEPPGDVHQAYRLDFGPMFATRGIATFQPPRTGAAFLSLVPQVDEDGNDRGGVRLPQLVVPLATYTGWNLRDPRIGAPVARMSFIGSYVPFAHDEVTRRYHNRDEYVGRYARAALVLMQERYLLREDLATVIERGIAEWDEVMK